MADSALRYFVGGKATSSLGRFIGAKTTKHLVNMISASAVHVGQRHLCRSGGVPDCSPRLWWEKSASQQKVMGIDRSRDLTMQGRGTRSISCGAVARKKDDGYISGHVQFEEGKVEDFLKEVGCEYKEQPSNGWLQIKECPDQVAFFLSSYAMFVTDTASGDTGLLRHPIADQHQTQRGQPRQLPHPATRTAHDTQH
eukprot:204513-Rhodomonas_salina.5